MRRAELAEQSREEEEMAARVEAEVSRRVAEAVGTEAIAARIEAKLKVGRHAKKPSLRRVTLLELCRIAGCCKASHAGRMEVPSEIRSQIHFSLCAEIQFSGSAYVPACACVCVRETHQV